MNAATVGGASTFPFRCDPFAMMMPRSWRGPVALPAGLRPPRAPAPASSRVTSPSSNRANARLVSPAETDACRRSRTDSFRHAGFNFGAQRVDGLELALPHRYRDEAGNVPGRGHDGGGVTRREDNHAKGGVSSCGGLSPGAARGAAAGVGGTASPACGTVGNGPTGAPAPYRRTRPTWFPPTEARGRGFRDRRPGGTSPGEGGPPRPNPCP